MVWTRTLLSISTMRSKHHKADKLSQWLRGQAKRSTRISGHLLRRRIKSASPGVSIATRSRCPSQRALMVSNDRKRPIVRKVDAAKAPLPVPASSALHRTVLPTYYQSKLHSASLLLCLEHRTVRHMHSVSEFLPWVGISTGYHKHLEAEVLE